MRYLFFWLQVRVKFDFMSAMSNIIQTHIEDWGKTSAQKTHCINY